MGWIYGSTIVTGNNNLASSNSAISHQYDKIFSNRYLMDNTAFEDNVFLGRKVLVDYNQSLLDTLLRVIKIIDKKNNQNEEDIINYYYWKNNLTSIQLTKDEFEANKENNKYLYKINNDYFLLEDWLTSFDESTEFFINSYTVLDLVSKASIPKNTYVYMSNIDTPNKLSDITVLQCTSELIYSKTDEPAELSTSSTLNDYLQANSTLSFYEFNKYIDKNQYSSQGIDYVFDSTVWQKVYINNVEKYIMIAKLNADNPNIDLQIIQPRENGLPNIPAMNVNGEDEYKLYMSMQPGLRISNRPNYQVYIYKPSNYYYKGENLEFVLDESLTKQNKEYYIKGSDGETYTLIQINFDSFPQDRNVYKMLDGKYVEINSNENWDINNTHVVLSDAKVKYSYYTNNTPTHIETVDNQDGAIFFNKDGFNKEKRSYFNAKPDQITSQFDGKSGYQYQSEEIYYPIIFKIITDEDGSIISSANEQYVNYDKTNLYYLVDDEAGYRKVNSADSYDSTLQYFVKTTSLNSNIDTHQLEIILPTIGNMVCEGWDKIYGTQRNLKQYKYSYRKNEYHYYVLNTESFDEDQTYYTYNDQTDEYNKAIDLQAFEDGVDYYIVDDSYVNLDENNLVGLYNNMVANVSRLKSYDENFSTTTQENIAKSFPLRVYDESTNEGTFTKTEPLTGNNIIQNQININNLGMKCLIGAIGLDSSQSFGYEKIPNVTEESYQPNLYYYYDLETDTYELDKSNDFKASKDYYIYRANDIKLGTQTQEGATIQQQINNNYSDITNNITNLECRQADLKSLSDIIGLSYTGYSPSTSGSFTYNNVTDNTLQGQIKRNDADITNIINLLGFERDSAKDQNSDENSNEGTIYCSSITQSGTTSHSLQSQIRYNRYDIAKLAERIDYIEKFLKAGNFLFTKDRDLEYLNYNADNLSRIPGDQGYNYTEDKADKRFSEAEIGQDIST